MKWLALITVILAIAVLICVAIIIYTKKKFKNVIDLQGKYSDLEDELIKRYESDKAALEKQYQNLSDGLQKQFVAKSEQDNQAYLKQCLEHQTALTKLQSENAEKVEKIQKELVYYEDLQSAVVTNYLEAEKKAKLRDFHRVILDDVEKSDISKLRPVAEQLSKPIILYKLIYEIYYKPKLDVMFKQILGTSESSGGIYKITNINDGRVYIGRATKFLDRWRQHAKCGTGADKGAQINVRLYEAMKREGIENFTFEVLDECATEDQAAREKYWVDYYRSMEYGYNIKSGG